MSALMFLDITHGEKIYRKTVSHSCFAYTAQEIRDILNPFIEGKETISRRILSDRLRIDFSDQEIHSILCSAVKRGMLILRKRAEFARRVFEICQKSKSPGKMSTLEEF